MNNIESEEFGEKQCTANMLLSLILKELEDKRIRYCIARNYRDYPKIITGDVDIIVENEMILKAIGVTIEIGIRCGWKVFYSYNGSNVAYVGLYAGVLPERFVLVVEFFSGGIWRGLKFIKADKIIEMRERYKDTYRPNNSHEAMLTFFHHLLYNGTIFDKYKESILINVSLNSSYFEDCLCKAIGRKRAEQLTKLILNGSWDIIAKQATKVRISFILKSMIISPIDIFVNIIKGLKQKAKKGNGIAICLEGRSSDELNIIAREILRIANKWHIFLPQGRGIIKLNSLAGSYSFKKKIASGTVVIALCNQNVKLSETLRDRVFNIILIEDQVTIKYKNNKIIIGNSKNEIGYKIWDYLLGSLSTQGGI